MNVIKYSAPNKQLNRIWLLYCMTCGTYFRRIVIFIWLHHVKNNNHYPQSSKDVISRSACFAIIYEKKKNCMRQSLDNVMHSEEYASVETELSPLFSFYVRKILITFHDMTHSGNKI